MTKINRRSMLGLLGSVPLAAGFTWTDAEAAAAAQAARTARTTPAGAKPALFKPKFFTAREYATVRVLVDLILPKDARSGSATDAGVPEFMDFMMADDSARQTPMRGGLAWIDHECEDRFDKRFLECDAAQRTAVLFGNEAQGLGQRWLELCDRRVTIPMQLGTDSLNVHVAAAVVLYELMR